MKTEKSLNRPKAKVAILILNWNQPFLTIKCLESLEKIEKSGLELSIYLLDNGSQNSHFKKLAEYLKKKHPLKIKLFRSSYNLGFAKGNNLLIGKAIKAKTDYVCFLNNDTWVKADFLTHLLATAESQKKIGAVGGKIYYKNKPRFSGKKHLKEKNIFWYAGGKINWDNPYILNRGINEIDEGQYEKPEKVDFITGCLLLVKVKVLKKISGFDERFFNYYEDADLGLRIQRAGYDLLYCPKAIIWHLVSASSKGKTDFQDYFGTRNVLLFVFKWAPLKFKLQWSFESLRKIFKGNNWERKAIIDFLLRKFYRGSWRWN